ncbi:TrmH family RNA methyltransferase [Paenibacillaceae bacterium]|nr:TrmH family RNA methyltransferase [Paenibacillaceae bacterium]
MTFKSYKKDYDYSYSNGVFPTIELLQHRPNIIEKILLHSKGSQNQGIKKIIELCNQHGIVFELNDKLVSKLSTKENCYAIGIFSKPSDNLSDIENHIVLVNPGDMGNLGTIIRTAVGFGITNLGIIRPAVDAYDPKVIRGSMGSFFKMSIQYFDSFQEYMTRYFNEIYTFRLNAQTTLNNVKINGGRPYTLLFGNESSGLAREFNNIGYSVKIPHGYEIDSLNLAIAVAIAVHHFTNN